MGGLSEVGLSHKENGSGGDRSSTEFEYETSTKHPPHNSCLSNDIQNIMNLYQKHYMKRILHEIYRDSDID